MSSEPRYHPGADMQGFVRELMEFVELGDADVATIRRTAPVILQHEQAITAALYEHFLKFPSTARFFLKDDGTPDPQRLERRKHSLGRWQARVLRIGCLLRLEVRCHRLYRVAIWGDSAESRCCVPRRR